MKKAEINAAIVFLILSGYVIWEASQMPPSATFGPGAAFLPFWLGVILALLATILLVSAVRRPATEKDRTQVFPGKQALFSIAGVMVGLGAYISLIEILGYLVDTFLFVLFLMKVVERERWRLSLIVSVCTTVGLFVMFQLLLRIALPSNMFGF